MLLNNRYAKELKREWLKMGKPTANVKGIVELNLRPGGAGILDND